MVYFTVSTHTQPPRRPSMVTPAGVTTRIQSPQRPHEFDIEYLANLTLSSGRSLRQPTATLDPFRAAIVGLGGSPI